MLSSEHGKVIADSKGDIQRGLEVIEFCCGIPHVLKGEYTHGAGPGIDVYSMRQPLGIGAGITPFNFPAMIPMWMFGVAIATGNAFILKPCERDPTPAGAAGRTVHGRPALPDGVFSVVHGDKEMVDAILDHPDIGAISFVGSSDIAHYIYAARLGERQARPGDGRREEPRHRHARRRSRPGGRAIWRARPSARPGERCMALPVVVPVGEKTAERLRAKLLPAIAKLRVGVSTDPDAHYGPVVTRGAQGARSKATSRWASTKAPSWSSMAAASRCRAMRRASSSARRCSTM